MTARNVTAVGLLVVLSAVARGQALPTSARVDTQPLVLATPERYLVLPVLQPARRVTLVAAADGIVRSQDAHEGADVRSGQEVAQLDRAESTALLKIARAEVKEQQASLAQVKAQSNGNLTDLGKSLVAQAEARLEAAQARVELAQAGVDRCTLRAPFAGRLMESFVSDGQHVSKGAVIAELADVSSLRALIPLTRGGSTVGSTVTVTVEGQPVEAKVQALLPLSEGLGVLRELATPMAAAWVVVSNTGGTFEPGQRVLSPSLPTLPLANIPAHAVQDADGKKGSPTVQVIRNEYVTNLPVRVLGIPAPERLQVSAAFHPTDALIVASSVPLQPGTLIRFGAGHGNGGTGVEGTTPNPAVTGQPADVIPPRPGSSSGATVPKGRTSSTATRPSSRATPETSTPASRPASKPAGGNVPF